MIMNLRKDRIFNRVTGLFDDGVSRVQDAADDLQHRLRKDGRKVARKARRGYSDGRDRVLSAEETVAQAVRENPSLFAVVALVLIGIIVGRILISKQSTMPEEEW